MNDKGHKFIKSLPPDVFWIWQEAHFLTQHFYDAPCIAGGVNLAHCERVAERILERIQKYRSENETTVTASGCEMVYPVAAALVQAAGEVGE